MPPKDKKNQKTPASTKSSTFGESDEIVLTPRFVSLNLVLCGETAGPGDFNFLTIYNGQVIFEGRWRDGVTFETEALPLNLRDVYYHGMVADRPLIFLLRAVGGKGSRDPDPLLNIDNRAAATVDLFPLIIGQERIETTANFVSIQTGESTGCEVDVHAYASGVSENQLVSLMLTMVSAHCMPIARDGTVYVSALGLDGLLDRPAVNFGMSLSNKSATKIVWATASNAGYGANTAFNVPIEDKYIPEDLKTKDTNQCISVYWNAMKRVLIDPVLLSQRLVSPFLIEMAGVPRVGKVDVRGRYMGFIDAGVLLHPGILGVTTCTKLFTFNEMDLPEKVAPLLELPPVSAKATNRETELVFDDNGHQAYVVIRFDLIEPLVAKAKIAYLFEVLGFPPPEGSVAPVDDLYVEPAPEDNLIDSRRISQEGGALSVHKELSGFACRGAVPMNQSIKRTAANRLLIRVRSMLKQFAPGDCSYIEWQDTVSGQHGASRRAVTSSFAPQPPRPRPSSRIAASRCRLVGDTIIANKHIKRNLKFAKGQPRPLLSKVLRCLEEDNAGEARTYLLEALGLQTRNRYLLWLFGAQEFNKGPEGHEIARAAFRIAVKGDYSNGTTNAIGWAALHALYHFSENSHAAFVAATKMRKSYELPQEWKKFLLRWTRESGEEEIFWIPRVISPLNPILIASAFFLCLRCYDFSDRLLQCVEEGCFTRGSHRNLKIKKTVDIYYIQAAAFILKHELDKALEVTQEGIKKFGPSAIMSQMFASCLICARGWDGKCESALKEAERAGAEPCPALLLRAALGSLKTNPELALQQAARAHQLTPSAHSALIISRVYFKLNEDRMAERWAAASVKLEPLLADGWAFLALIATYQRDPDKAKTMLRTAKQVGVISTDILGEVKAIMSSVKMESLPDRLVQNLCFCKSPYYQCR